MGNKSSRFTGGGKSGYSKKPEVSRHAHLAGGAADTERISRLLARNGLWSKGRDAVTDDWLLIC